MIVLRRISKRRTKRFAVSVLKKKPNP